MFTNNRSRIAAGGTKSIGLSLFHEGIGGLTYVISACIGLHKWVPASGRLTEILIQNQTVLLGSYKLLQGVKGFRLGIHCCTPTKSDQRCCSIGSTALVLWSLWL